MKIRAEPGWKDLALEIASLSGPKLVYVIGASNTGKTTLCGYLTRILGARALTAYLDCDPGQSSIGPPATIGLGKSFGGKAGGKAAILSFVGSLSPVGHLLPCLTGIRKLSGIALAQGCAPVVLDSSGFVLGGAAREFQFHVIDLIRPEFLVAIQLEDELEGLLMNFAAQGSIRIRRMRASGAVRARDPLQRQEYRARKFRTYFRDACLQDLDLSGRGMRGTIPGLSDPETPEDLLVAMCDKDHLVVALGVVRSFDPQDRTLSVFAPRFDPHAVCSIAFGSVRLDTRAFRTRSAPRPRMIFRD